MADLQEADFGAAYYRSLDPIKYLKIRVHLERVTSASIVPQAQIERESGGNVEMQQIKMRQNFGVQKDAESYTFSWQEKVFSKREVELYRDGLTCTSVLDRKYHTETKPYREGRKRSTSRLFSYVSHDAFTNKDENAKKMTTSANETPTFLAEKMLDLRLRRKIPTNKSNNNSGITKQNLVELNPSEELIKQNHYMSAGAQTMHIMADLANAEKESTEADEFVLVTIKFDAYGVIHIKPDFNKGSKPYRLETHGIGRDVFEYTLEHASEQLSRIEQEKETRMFRDLYSRHTEYLSSLVGHDFELPPTNALRVICYGEIISAKNFDYDDLYIHYFIEPKKNWHPVGTNQLSGITQVCSTKVIGRDSVAYYGFPFNFEMIYKSDSLDKESDALPKWPQFYVEVLSLDTWERYRTEGYGHITLPSSPGIFEETINCWRPAGRSCFGELRRYFIGGTPELEDPTYAAIPSTFEGQRLSKFGFKSVSSGSVSLKFNIIQQSDAFLKSASSKKKTGHLLETLVTSQAQADIGNVLDAFTRAKNVMIATRENLKTDYRETLKALEDEIDDD